MQKAAGKGQQAKGSRQKAAGKRQQAQADGARRLDASICTHGGLKLLHGPPRLVIRHVSELHPRHLSARVIDPLWWVARLEGDVAQRDWEVDEVEVDVGEAEVRERLRRGGQGRIGRKREGE